MAREQRDVRAAGRGRGRGEVGRRSPGPASSGERAPALVAFASRLDSILDSILGEIGGTLGAVKPGEVDGLARAITDAGRVYVAGAGRSGLVASCFAMRLVHLGLVAHVAGEATAPGLGEGDLLIVSSGSGRTGTSLARARAAKEHGAKVAAVTADGVSPVARAADVVVELACPPFADPVRRGDAGQSENAGRATIQPGGSLFEQSLLLFYDALVIELADRLAWSPETLEARHANLE